MKRKSLRII